jgi:hypothetical protein
MGLGKEKIPQQTINEADSTPTDLSVPQT